MLTQNRSSYITEFLQIENQYWQPVVHAHRNCRTVHYFEAAYQNFHVGEMLKQSCTRMLGRAAIENPVHRVTVLQDNFSADFHCAQAGRAVSGKVWTAGPSREDQDASLFQMADGAAPDVGFAYRLDGQGGHDAGPGPDMLKRVLQGQRVHDRRQHSHVVGRSAIHSTRLVAGAAHQVAAPNYHRDLDRKIGHFFDLFRDGGENLMVDTKARGGRQSFTG